MKRDLRNREDGFSIVEFLVGVSVLAVIVTLAAQSLLSVIKANRSNEVIDQSTQIAQDVLGLTESTPWRELGMLVSEDGFVCSEDAESLEEFPGDVTESNIVRIKKPSDASNSCDSGSFAGALSKNRPMLLNNTVIDKGQREFTINTAITWLKKPIGVPTKWSSEYGIKRVWVKVEWNAGANVPAGSRIYHFDRASTPAEAPVPNGNVAW